jgi:hypothetical protein
MQVGTLKYQMPTQDRESSVCDALYVAWKLEADANSAGSMQQMLTGGEDRNLYRLRSWMVARGDARALLTPSAPLEEIADALWTPIAPPVSTRWIAGQRRCAAVTREIERAPVQLGLARRPEEWPFSSAFED